MRITYIAFLAFALALTINSCTSKNIQDEKSVESDSPPTENPGGKNIQRPPSVMGVDESVNTKWVKTIPEENLLVVDGRIGITGNEPNVKIVIYGSDDIHYALSGSEKFMNYIMNFQHQEIIIAGAFYLEDGIKWLKVLYVLKK